MTDDLIERLDKFMGEYGDAEDECISQAADALTVAQARIAELEAVQTGHTTFYEYDKRRLERGRLQGLDEAKETVLSLWAFRTCAEVANAIEALKTKEQGE